MRTNLLNIICIFALLIETSACHQAVKQQQSTTEKKDTTVKTLNAEMPLNTVNPPKPAGSIDRLSPKLDSVLSKESRLEIIAEGFVWSEGPLWLPKQNKLIFSDVPRNCIFQWSEKDGLSLYIDSSGYAGPPKGLRIEPGSNGLTLDANDNLILCQHGNRQIARMNAPLDHPKPIFTSLANSYKGKRFNSPNDVIVNSKDDIYFTDPPYGLPDWKNNPAKELDFQGVYKLMPDGKLTVIDSTLTFPNGIGLSPDEKTLYVSVSDPGNPVIMAYKLNNEGLPIGKRTFFDASKYSKERPGMGLPDGLKLDKKGNLFAAGPGGIYIINPKGELLGIINTGHPNGNCAFNADKSTLYITADMYLMRVKVR